MAYLLQDTSDPQQFYAGVQGTRILWATYADGIIFAPVVFITEAALEEAQVELESLTSVTRYEL